MDGFAFLRRKEKFVASFRSAIHAFLLFQPLRWLKWLLVPGGKERELNIWRHDRPERGMWVHQLTCNRRDDHADKGVQCDLGDNVSGRQPRVGFTGELCDGNSDVPRSRTPLLPDDAKLAEAYENEVPERFRSSWGCTRGGNFSTRPARPRDLE